MKTIIHRLKHLLKIERFELREIIHEPTCPGFCFLSGSNIPQCKWKAKLTCLECGKVEWIV